MESAERRGFNLLSLARILCESKPLRAEICLAAEMRVATLSLAEEELAPTARRLHPYPIARAIHSKEASFF